MFVIYRPSVNLYAACDIDWNTLSQTTICFDEGHEARLFLTESIWEEDATIIWLPLAEMPLPW